MKIATYNVNSIRIRLDTILAVWRDWIQQPRFVTNSRHKSSSHIRGYYLMRSAFKLYCNYLKGLGSGVLRQVL